MSPGTVASGRGHWTLALLLVGGVGLRAFYPTLPRAEGEALTLGFGHPRLRSHGVVRVGKMATARGAGQSNAEDELANFERFEELPEKDSVPVTGVERRVGVTASERREREAVKESGSDDGNKGAEEVFLSRRQRKGQPPDPIEELAMWDPELRRLKREGVWSKRGQGDDAPLGADGLPEVSDEEVDSFLQELEERPNVPGYNNKQLDIFEKGQAGRLDIFDELRDVPERLTVYDRGLPHREEWLTLKERVQLLSEFAGRGDWQESRKLMKTMWAKRRLRMPLGRILFNLMIKAHVQAGRNDAAEFWLVDMLERVFQPDLFSYNTLLSGFAREGEYVRAEKWLARMRARGVEPDVWTWAALANAHSEAGDLLGAERTLDSMEADNYGGVSAMPYNAVIKACAAEGDKARAERWFSRMVDGGARPDHVSYLLLIKAHTQTGDMEGAERWLERIRLEEGDGVRIGRQHYHAVMSGYARIGDLVKTHNWMQAMQSRKLYADRVTYNILFSAASKSGATDTFEGLLKKMRKYKIEPDVVTFSTAIGAFAELGDVEQALAWLTRAEEEGVEPDLKCYNQVLKACARAGNYATAESLMRKLLRSKLTPDSITYNTLLAALAEGGAPAMSEYWVDHMTRASRWRQSEFSSQQLSVAYAEVLRAYARAGDLSSADAWLNRMLSEGLEPDLRCYTAVARGHLLHGNVEEAQLWCERMASWSSLRPPKHLLAEVKLALQAPAEAQQAVLEQ